MTVINIIEYKHLVLLFSDLFHTVAECSVWASLR